MALEWIDGVPLQDVLAEGNAPAETCRVVGAALARLHAQKPKKLATFWTPQRFAQVLADAAVAVGEIAPSLADRATTLSDRVAAKMLTRHWRDRRGIHGDLSADQVLVLNGGVALIDFDRAGCGDPRLDLGTFRARLIYDVICGNLSEQTADSCLGIMLDEYRHVSGKDLTRKYERHTAAALLQYAVEPFRHRRPDWLATTEELLSAAEGLVAASVPA